MKFFKKYHKWLGLIVSLFLIIFSISGIILNHRYLLSSVDISRKWMPDVYSYKNWNNAAVRSAITIAPNQVLVYGNMGIYLSDSNLTQFTDYTKGFDTGIDNKKIDKIFKDSKGNIYAGSLFGLYRLNLKTQVWQKVKLPNILNPRIVDITEHNNELWVVTRSEILKTKNGKTFEIYLVPVPEGYQNKIGLFKTLWLIHSGEVYGFIGKILVDIVGLIFIFLTLTGLFYFFNKKKLKHHKAKNVKTTQTRNRFYLRWHNKIGWISLIFLIITTATGMFLRPPLLIPIADAKVGKLPYTTLDTPNPWFDQLRKIYFDKAQDRIIVATINGVYYSDDNFNSNLKRFDSQPPISVMGINAFEAVAPHQFLVGSFEGLFLWNTKTGSIYDYIEQKPYVKPIRKGPPIGNFLIAGYFKNAQNKELIFDYDKGLLKPSLLPKMPKSIEQTPISLWNISVEYHTGRIYEVFLGPLYILIVPLVGLMGLFILISGFIVWWKKYRNKVHAVELDSVKYDKK